MHSGKRTIPCAADGADTEKVVEHAGAAGGILMKSLNHFSIMTCGLFNPNPLARLSMFSILSFLLWPNNKTGGYRFEINAIFGLFSKPLFNSDENLWFWTNKSV